MSSDFLVVLVVEGGGGSDREVKGKGEEKAKSSSQSAKGTASKPDCDQLSNFLWLSWAADNWKVGQILHRPPGFAFSMRAAVIVLEEVTYNTQYSSTNQRKARLFGSKGSKGSKGRI